MDPSTPSVPIDRVVATEELSRRPCRPPDHEAESRALVALAQQMASSPREILQRLVDTALALCRADSAGLSLIEADAGRHIFRWHAVAGSFAPNVFGTTPREFSPCGTVVDRNAVMLFSRPGRHFGYLNEVPPAIEEALLVPFAVNGVPVGTIWVMSTSERCRFDAEDARILQSLGTFASAAYQIQSSLETIRAADRNKTEFLAMLGHELRNPLAPISTSLGVLRHAGAKSPAVLSVAEMIGRQLAQLVRLVDDLLDVSRIGQGKIELRQERCDLRSAVKQAVETVGPVVESRNHELILSLPDSPLYSYGDPIRLAQVVGNLLSNACKFSEKNAPVRLSLARDGEHAVVRVRDEGIGIAPDQLGQVFGMFTQLNDRDHSRGGLGVGLSLVKGLVEMHGGTVTAHSDGLGRGSEFVVCLPAVP